MNLARMAPRRELASTSYCLANPGREYLVFNPGSEPFTVRGLEARASYRFEWFDPAKHRQGSSGSLRAAAPNQRFEAPVANAVLYLVAER